MTSPELTTLCYLEKDHQYLMLHRVVKAHDLNKDKWIGVGGHVEAGESPDDCVVREVQEETDLTLTDYCMRGVITFLSGRGAYEYMFLYTADGWTSADGSVDSSEVPHSNSEGILEWVDIDDVEKLNLWEGDRIFLKLLAENAPFFSLKLTYDSNDRLTGAVLNGKPYTF